MFFLKVFLLFIISLLLTAFSEVFLHKFLFHRKKNGINKLIANIWNYDIAEHVEHHLVCKDHIEDKIMPNDSYWVQKPSNVFCAGFLVFILEVIVLCILQASFIFYLLAAAFVASFFTFWYQFEDHFHIGMHKKEYYEKFIKNTWQEKWFKFCKRLHIIHHRDDRYNYGFIFFPIGDMLIGTYKSNYREILLKGNTQEKISE